MSAIANGMARPIDYARDYVAAGLSVVPIGSNGTKRPCTAWKRFQASPPSESEITSLWSAPDRGIAIVHGAVSGGTEVVDLDDGELLEPFVDALDHAAPGLYQRLCVVQTPRPGYHVAYRCESIQGNQKLAMRPPEGDEAGPVTLVETRGEGGYTLAPGTPGSCHPTGREYLHVGGPSLTKLSVISTEERAAIFMAARSLDQMPAVESETTAARMPESLPGKSPGDAYANATSWAEILEPHGWVHVGDSGDRQLWRRPGKSDGWSATTGCLSKQGNDLLCVFSTNAHPFPGPDGRGPCSTHTKFDAHAQLEHAGDHSATARDLARRGYGDGRVTASDSEYEPDGPAESVFANAVEIELESEGGQSKTVVKHLTMPEVRAEADKLFDKWPRRVGSALFVHDDEHGIGWLDKPDALFGWMQSQRRVRWHGGKEAVSRPNLHAELCRTAIAYEAVESLPHFPPMNGAYYACSTPGRNGGDKLRELLERFTPTTTVDRDLILAAFATTFWGGPPGCRPAFVLTSEAGRGAGKTTAVETIGAVAGGLLAFEPGEDVERMKQRLLSPEALCKRVALIDNVKRTRFSWGELEALITTPTISGKRLYIGEAQRPNTLTWFITLNGVALSTDLAQRSVVIKLNKPTYSGTWKEDTWQFIAENRSALIGDLARFFEGQRWPLPKSSRWGSWENDVLSRLPEPGEAQAVILERQAECDADDDDGQMIDEYVGERLGGYGYDASTAQVRIPNAILADWFSEATGEQMTKTAITRRLKQMSDERQLRRLRPDAGRAHGRCFIYTGPTANTMGCEISNDLRQRMVNAV